MQSSAAPRSLFNEAIGLINAGQLAAAEASCRAALDRHPGDVNMQALLGAVLVKLGRHTEAEATLRAVIDAAPTFAKPAEDLGYLLLQAGRPADALPFLEQATRLDPSLERAWFDLGKALAQVGRGKEADAAFEKSFELSPERRLMALAAEHQKEGRREEAERIYRRVLRENPKNVDALRLLALIASDAGHADDAEAMLRKAVELAPDFLLALLDLGRLCKEQDRFADALACFDRMIELEPSQPQAHYQRAATLARASFTPEAIASYRRCLALRADHPGALLGLGHVLKAVGDYEGSVAAYRACIETVPGSGESYWSLANLKTYRFDDTTIAEMERRAVDPDVKPSSRVNFLFALGKAHEDRGNFERAWERYRAGNEAQRATVSYDPVQTEVMNDRLLATYTADFLAAHAGERQPGPGAHLHPRPAALGLDAARADPREPQPGRGHERVALRRARRDLAQPQSRRRHQLSRGDARAQAGPHPGARRRLPGAGPDAPAHGRTALHRQDAEQLPERRAHRADAAEREDHRRAPASAGRLPVLLAPAVRQGPELSPTT